MRAWEEMLLQSDARVDSESFQNRTSNKNAWKNEFCWENVAIWLKSGQYTRFAFDVMAISIIMKFENASHFMTSWFFFYPSNRSPKHFSSSQCYLESCAHTIERNKEASKHFINRKSVHLISKYASLCIHCLSNAIIVHFVAN